MANLKPSELKIKTFEAKFRKHHFYVDVVEFGTHHHEAWIYTDKMGVKELMFGNGYGDEERFMELVFANFEEYAELYIKKHSLRPAYM